MTLSGHSVGYAVQQMDTENLVILVQPTCTALLPGKKLGLPGKSIVFWVARISHNPLALARRERIM